MLGLVLRAQSGFFWVDTKSGVLECKLRGRLKKERQSSDIAVIGDEVEVTQVDAKTGVIESVYERRTKLARRSAGSRGLWKEDVLVANVDQVALVFACTSPEFSSRMLDRYLVICEYSELDTLIIANKVDLVEEADAQTLFATYETIGYPVLYTSATSRQGIDALCERLHGRISVVTGRSGVGKSSLLNAVQPDLDLATGAISAALNKGRHITTVAELIPLKVPGGGYVADTPGIREIGLWNIPADEIDIYFREFRPFVNDCYFSGCTHLHEPDCAIRQAVEDGDITMSRYDSYVRLRTDA